MVEMPNFEENSSIDYWLSSRDIDHLLKFYEEIDRMIVKLEGELKYKDLSSYVMKEIRCIKDNIKKLIETLRNIKKQKVSNDRYPATNFFKNLMNLNFCVIKAHGNREKGYAITGAFKLIFDFEYKLARAIEEIRDHFVHSINVYLLGLIVNLFLFAHHYCVKFHVSERYSNYNGPLILPLSFAWLITAKLHDVGYVFEKKDLLIKAFPYLSEFLDYDKATILSTLEPVFSIYGKIVAKNNSIYGESINREILREKIETMYPNILRSYISEILATGQGVHGTISCFITFVSVLRKNPFSKGFYWPVLYYEPVLIGLFAQMYHSIIPPEDGISQVPLLLPLYAISWQGHGIKRMSYRLSGYSYIPLLLLIFDEVIDFGRPTLRSRRPRWHVKEIKFENMSELSIIVENDVGVGKPLHDVLTNKLKMVGLKCDRTGDTVCEFVLEGPPFFEDYRITICKRKNNNDLGTLDHKIKVTIRISEEKDGSHKVLTKITFIPDIF